MEVETISEPKLRKGFFLFLSLVLEEQFSKNIAPSTPIQKRGKILKILEFTAFLIFTIFLESFLYAHKVTDSLPYRTFLDR